ncbi:MULTISPECIES: hydroxymethylglutaryl-CoA lyase [unclassified Pedobacter]|uniref:hydroxymethylglutaryl-CoA lyase n=1 Tax=unclassified Pedobacter TaxID=2628915 RepID=UPI0014210867|nr:MULTISPECIES: hydroxymethylglutaryl-CoA lyase [unclassified Pedobacter]NII83639.1 hydroxymethylglutaryl-CoA lyase [Pedobacter sp. SG908]NMN37499.1 hydroxymethylglutaryl-CoA lyase [Pedobacter sp. SG918]
MSQNNFKLVECPRDAMQGLHDFVPTELKVEYLNLLLQVGFDTLDFGSFVSPKAIPQMADTAEVLAQLDLGNTNTKLLAIVANLRGIESAAMYQHINYLGFPFSISETFQQRNTNSSITQSLSTVEEMLSLCAKNNKKAVVYLSMGFGNPYGDEWNYEIVEKWADVLVSKGVEILSLADTVGISTPEKIATILPRLISRFNGTEIGIHLHSTPAERFEKIEAAYHSGVKRIDSALKGFGGCPMAADDLTGNIATEDVIAFLNAQGESLSLNMDKWNEAMVLSGRIFG